MKANLPQIWHQWANCAKWHELQILSELLHAFSCSADAFSSSAPVVSPKLLHDLLNFVFVVESPDDIKTGIQAFAIADGSAEHRQANLEILRMYPALASGETALLLADLEALKANEVVSIPLTYFEVESCLGMFGNLLGVVLGCTLALMQAYRSSWPWARHFPHRDALTHALPPLVNLTSVYHANWQPTLNKIPHCNVSNPPPLQ
jgi:hypothetical protein